jgi:hypothetical protein
MPKYEFRKGGKVIEKIEAKHGGHEDTRLGLAAADNRSERDGWVKVESFTDPKAKQADENKAA